MGVVSESQRVEWAWPVSHQRVEWAWLVNPRGLNGCGQ